ncbi:MAG: acyltransferase domain-containing protein, partial [Desulfobacterales bacterium]|nr:acyltransferase domain-containing protein [Desulfobacterales bacterium]
MKEIEKKTDQNMAVAIIGMGCYFPKSSGLKKYWHLLFHGEDAITDIPETHWSAEDYYDKDPKKPDHIYCKRGGFLSPVLFDPSEFGIPPNSLESTDTSQILGLITAKTALEDAGYGVEKSFNRDKTSVILGVTGTQELVIPLSSRLGHPKWRKALQDSGVASDTAEEVIQRISDSYLPWHENSFPGLLGNVVAGRICNRLDLKGTNCVVDAACGSSLGAIHFAIIELLSGRSDMVLTGGVDTLNDIFMHMCFAKTSVLSPNGDAKPFSEDADGTVLGEGVGILVLKRLADAQKDGDRIYAVIKALGSSSDGKSQGIYAPRAEGQEQALRAAYRYANVDPATVELIEAHGTGTPVGDRVEFQALKKIFTEFNKNGNRCALGSVKSMIGHTKAAAGAAGIIKAALALYNKTLLPTLKADKPDPKLGISKSPFYLCREIRPWFSKNGHPRRSGVSAFGFGGSNFHAVLEEYQETKTEISWDGSVEIIALSAASQQELISCLKNFKTKLFSDSTDSTLARIASQSRKDFTIQNPYRLLLVLERPFDPNTDFKRALESLEANKHSNGWNIGNLYYGGPEKPGKIAFVFPGQGSQYVGMGRDLICCFPEAFQILESINKKYKGPHRLTDYIYPYPAQTPEEKQTQESALRSTDIAQPAIGAVSLAMLNILRAFGIRSDATCGHSYGELSALLAADWIDLETFFHLSIARGKFMAASGKNSTENNGAMLAVNAPLDELTDLIATMATDVVIANRNSPNQGVLSGPVKSIAQADKICKQRGLRTIPLPVSAAFHSSMVKDAQEPFMQILQSIQMIPSDTPVFSNTTGKAYPKNSDAAKKLLGEQILRPVDFVSEIEEIYRLGVRTFLEIGPKSILTGLVKSILKDRDIHAIALDSSAGKRFAMADIAGTLCHLASIGHPVQLERWEHPVQEAQKQRMHIPVAGANPKPKIGSVSPTQRPPVNQTTEHPPKKQETSAHVTPLASSNLKVTFNETSSLNRSKETLQTSSSSGKKNMMDKIDTEKKQKHSNFILDALKVVQEGLKSMQALQMQTAETHKKFLEAQTEASRTLQEMMASTQRLAQTSIQSFCQSPDDSHAWLTAQDAGLNNFTTTTSSSSNRIQSTKKSEPIKPIDLSNTSQIEKPMPKISDTAEPDNLNQQEIKDCLLDVVSELTGYPVQMLALDMDIEADLGIDSIKRVEILSTLEEKLPNLPNIAPDVMGGLKTLEQITQYLIDAADQPSNLQPADTKTESPKKFPSAHTDQKEITNALL